MKLSKKQKEIIEAEEKYRLNIRKKLQTKNNLDLNILFEKMINYLKSGEKNLTSITWALNICELRLFSKNIWIPMIIIGFLMPFIHTNRLNPLLLLILIAISGFILGFKDKYFSLINGVLSIFLGVCLAEYFMDGAGVFPKFIIVLMTEEAFRLPFITFLSSQYIGSRFHLMKPYKNKLSIRLLSLKIGKHIILKLFFLATLVFSFVFVGGWLSSDTVIRSENFIGTFVSLLLIWMLFCLLSVGVLLAKRNRDVKLYQIYVFGFLFCMVLLFILGYVADIQSVKN
jgi:hypothetical protein